MPAPLLAKLLAQKQREPVHEPVHDLFGALLQLGALAINGTLSGDDGEEAAAFAAVLGATCVAEVVMQVVGMALCIIIGGMVLGLGHCAVSLRSRLRYVKPAALSPEEVRAAPAASSRSRACSRTPPPPIPRKLCAICLDPLVDPNVRIPLVHCRRACGRSVHRACFQLYQAKRRDAPCVWCGSRWT